MLHATQKNKSNLYRRYHGDRSDSAEEPRVSEEDEITSAIFGPMDFMSIDNAWRFWHALLQPAVKNELLTDEVPHSFKFELWPRRKIEPDGLLTFEWTNGKRLILMLEIKWRASLSGDRQLHDQWENFLKEDERQDAYHLFIAHSVYEGIAARSQEEKPIWNTDNHRLVLLSWTDIRAIFEKFTNQINSPVGRWAMYADSFLEKAGVYKFKGFGRLKNINLDELAAVEGAVFWNPFRGFSQLPKPIIDIANIQSPLLFNNN